MDAQHGSFFPPASVSMIISSHLRTIILVLQQIHFGTLHKKEILLLTRLRISIGIITHMKDFILYFIQ